MMNESLNKILLSKGYAFYDLSSVERKQSPTVRAANASLMAAIVKSFASLGYTFDPKSIFVLSSLNRPTLTDFYKKTYAFLKDASGASYNMKKVFYPQFPDVGDIPLAELYLNATLHYVSVFLRDMGCDVETYYPESEAYDQIKLPFDEEHKPTVLKLLTDEKQCVDEVLVPYFKDCFAAPIAISTENLAKLFDIAGYFHANGMNIPSPRKIPFRENIARYVQVLAASFGDADVLSGIKTYVKAGGIHFTFMTSVTDYLRLYCVLSGGSPMLDGKTKFVSLPRAVRRWFLSGLNEIFAASEYWTEDELAGHREIWLRAFERLHPGEFGKDYHRTAEAAALLRKDEIKTYNGELEALLAKPIHLGTIGHLMLRPGVYARRLDSLLRGAQTKHQLSMIANGWSSAATQVSVPLLYQIRDHLLHRPFVKPEDGRRFIIKTEKGVKIHVQDKDDRLPIPPDALKLAIQYTDVAISHRLGRNGGQKVYLGCPLEDLEGYALPTNDRSASGNLKDVPFGSYVKLNPEDGKDVVRLFTHWHNMDDDYRINGYLDRNHGRVDIDLSAQFFKEDFSDAGRLAWHDLSQNGVGIYFSGDITDAPYGANEFVDIDLNSFRRKKPDVRYIAIVNNVYTGQPFAKIPECCSGAMLRSSVNSGELFEPSSVVAKFDLHQDTAYASVSLVLDVVELRLYKIDQPLVAGGPVAASHMHTTGALIRRAVEPKTTLNDALRLAITGGRLKVVQDPKEADFVIGLDENANVHPWDQEKIAKILMQPLDEPKNKE